MAHEQKYDTPTYSEISRRGLSSVNMSSIAAARDELRFFQIAIEDVVVATRIGFQFGSELYLYHAGNDPAWDAYSIMTTLLAEIIKWAIDAKVTTLNLSTGMDRSKTRWKPIEVVYSDGVQVAPGLASHALWHIYDTLREQVYSGKPMRRLTGTSQEPRSRAARISRPRPQKQTERLIPVMRSLFPYDNLLGERARLVSSGRRFQDRLAR